MIISHEHRFIFLKTRKTAGTSVEIALSKFCGPDDIITTTPDEAARRAVGGRAPQNNRMPYRMIRPGEIYRQVRSGRRATVYNHMTADRVRQLVGAQTWSKYYKFAVERNPWDAMVSMYFWATQGVSPRPSFSEFLASPSAQRLVENWNIYTIRGELAVDELLTYEELSSGLDSIGQRLGLPGPLELPRANARSRPDSRYLEFYDESTAGRVASMFHRQIGLLGYEFG